MSEKSSMKTEILSKYKETNRDRFVRIVERRVNVILNNLDNHSNKIAVTGPENKASATTTKNGQKEELRFKLSIQTRSTSQTALPLNMRSAASNVTLVRSSTNTYRYEIAAINIQTGMDNNARS